MDDKKKYVIPEAEIVELADGDIITLSEADTANVDDDYEVL